MINDITEAFGGHLSGAWTGEVAWPGQPYIPKADTPYVAVRMAAQTRRAVGVGADVPRGWNGSWQAVVAVPSNVGVQAANDIAWAIARHYRRDTSFSIPSLHVTNADPRPPYQDGDFIRVPVLIEWFMLESAS